MSSKRKAASTAAASAANGADGHTSKRRKTPAIEEETPESTTARGLELLEKLKNARDKKDHLITTHFMELPDKMKMPEYYRQIGLPLSLKIIEDKLNRYEYPTLTTLESDLRRMASNAKSFNQKSSTVYSDAEKLRKSFCAWMATANPAYKDPNYSGFPTPVPEGWHEKLKQEEAEAAGDLDADGETDHEEEVKKEEVRKTRRPSTAGRSSSIDARRASSTPAVQDLVEAGESFEGDTFQQAQEKLISEMMHIKENDDDDAPMFELFINRPPRELKDYYQLIKHPVSLSSILKAVRGVKGREKPTGVSPFRGWRSFEEEVSFIWRNARQYNEDDSGAYILAGEFEEYFHRRLEEAKRAVQEPPQPKGIRLKLGAKTPEPASNPKITLRIGGTKIGHSTGVSVDSEALKRQQELVRAGSNGAGVRKPSTNANTPSGLGITSVDRPLQERTKSGSSDQPAINGMKKEPSVGQSPALGSVRLNNDVNGSNEAQGSPNLAAGTMLPPVNTTPRIASSSPHPQTISSHGHSHISHVQPGPFGQKWRDPAKGASEALITNLIVATHPALKIEKPFRLEIPASPSTTQQSITITLPATHCWLNITPFLSTGLIQRPNKHFVTANTQKLTPTDFSNPKQPVYEARVVPGVNRIEVEVLAGAVRGAPKVGSGQDIEFEKISIFANVMKP